MDQVRRVSEIMDDYMSARRDGMKPIQVILWHRIILAVATVATVVGLSLYLLGTKCSAILAVVLTLAGLLIYFAPDLKKFVAKLRKT